MAIGDEIAMRIAGLGMGVHRLAIFGNSHVACLRLAWNQFELSRPGVEVHWFMADRGEFGALQRRGDSLVPNSEKTRQAFARLAGGRAEIAIPEYDAFAICGLRFDFRPDVYCMTHRPVEFAGGEYAPISNSLLDALMRADVEACSSLRLARELRQSSRSRILLVRAPLPGEEMRNAQGLPEQQARYVEAVASGLAAYLMPRFESVCDSVANGIEAECVRQPDRTVYERFWTGKEYSALVDREGRPDFRHANPEYGRVLYDHIASLLDLPPSGIPT